MEKIKDIKSKQLTFEFKVNWNDNSMTFETTEKLSDFLYWVNDDKKVGIIIKGDK